MGRKRGEMKLQKYAIATPADLARVVQASETLYTCIAEFPDDRSCWTEAMAAFDVALESCPGTDANFYKQRRHNQVCSVTEAEQRFRDRYETDRCEEMTDEQWDQWV